MVKLLVGLTTAATITAIMAGQTAPVDAALDDPSFLAGLGISQPVYDCAKQALSGMDAEQLTALIKTLPDSEATSDARTALENCVKQDPFGFAIDGLTPDERVALNIINGGK